MQATQAAASRSQKEVREGLAREHQRIASHLNDLQLQTLKRQLADLKRFHEVCVCVYVFVSVRACGNVYLDVDASAVLPLARSPALQLAPSRERFIFTRDLCRMRAVMLAYCLKI